MGTVTLATGRTTRLAGKPSRAASYARIIARAPRVSALGNSRAHTTFAPRSFSRDRALSQPELTYSRANPPRCNIVTSAAPVTDRLRFNRQPVRLETIVTHRKQTTATHLNRQLFHTFPLNFPRPQLPAQISRPLLTHSHRTSRVDHLACVTYNENATN
jgi:hypothetical protein